ncbi:MAG: hypothetical protein IT385_15945 [Deltaproteobacteria bacterium]|nr:hypothetical protein [Deltaproteobacteria bacterium]
MSAPLDRGGHLSELALDVYRYDPGPHPEVESHLTACDACRAALAALVAEDAAARVPVPRARRRRPLAWIAGATTLLAAAAVAIIVTRPAPAAPDADGLRLKGGAFDLEVFVHDGERTRAVVSGDVVHPGERVGFRVRGREPGYLLVIGRDDQGNSYMCYPSGEVGVAVAQTFPETPEPQVLPVAMRFDDVLGSEHIVALLCPAPFAAADLGPGLVADADGCARHELTLHKRPRSGDGTPR